MPFSVRAIAAVFVICAFFVGIGVTTGAQSHTDLSLRHKRPSPTPTPTETPTPSPEPTPEPTPSPTESPDVDASAPPVVDITVGDTPSPHHVAKHASLYDLVGSPWECITFGGTKFTHDFSRTDDTQTILVDTVVTVKAKTLRLQEKFVHDAAKARWSVNIAKGSVLATAPEWTGKTWTFSGVSTETGKPKRIRMEFTMIGKDQYRRDFESLDGGTWSTYAGENCDRPL